MTSIATRPGPQTVYVCGNQNLWQSLNNGDAWRIVDCRGGPGDIAVSPTNGNYVVHAVGRHVFLSTNALAATVGGPNGVQFLDITRNLPNNSRNVQRVAFNPIDPTVIYAVLGGFDGPLAAQQGHVFRTTATSTTWTDISPPVDIPMGAIAIDATTTPATIYVGTDLGVVRTVDLGRSWSVVDDIHLPKVPVTDLEFSEQAGVLRAATFGRGVFEFAKPTGPSANLSLQDGLDFETVCPGEHRDLTLKVFNVGSADLTVVNVSTSVGSASFSVLPYPICPAIIKPGSNSTSSSATRRPTQGPPEVATIRVLTDDPVDAVDLLATGTCGIAALETVIPDNGDFGEVRLGRFTDRDLVINNRGPCRLSVTGIVSSAPVFVTPQVVSFPLTVDGGDSIAVPIRFQPTPRGAATATLTIVSNDPNGPAVVNVSGTAWPPLPVAGTALDGYPLSNDSQHVFFIGTDKHVHELDITAVRLGRQRPDHPGRRRATHPRQRPGRLPRSATTASTSSSSAPTTTSTSSTSPPVRAGSTTTSRRSRSR